MGNGHSGGDVTSTAKTSEMHNENRDNFGALNQRVLGLEQGLQGVQTTMGQLASRVEALFTGLNAKIEERGKTPWPVITSFAAFALSFVVVVGGLAYAPVISNLSRMEARQDKQELRTEAAVDRLAGTLTAQNERYYTTLLKADEKFMTNKEFEGRWTSSGQRRDDIQALNVSRMMRIEADISALEKSVVPRPEHEEKWRGSSQQFMDVQRQIDALRTQFNGIYTPRDALSSIQSKIDDLDKRVRNAEISK